MRPLFTDGWNSVWHFIFGVLSIKIPALIPAFLAYQYVLKYDDNSRIDTKEFEIGLYAVQGIKQSLISPKFATT
jgi:hypothetical protein